MWLGRFVFQQLYFSPSMGYRLFYDYQCLNVFTPTLSSFVYTWASMSWSCSHSDCVHIFRNMVLKCVSYIHCQHCDQISCMHIIWQLFFQDNIAIYIFLKTHWYHKSIVPPVNDFGIMMIYMVSRSRSVYTCKIFRPNVCLTSSKSGQEDLIIIRSQCVF
jgi:hypothetical protein